MKTPFRKMAKMGKMSSPFKGGSKVSGPSDVAIALESARPGKASRGSTMKQRLLGKG